jgi:hypothetical protein
VVVHVLSSPYTSSQGQQPHPPAVRLSTRSHSVHVGQPTQQESCLPHCMHQLLQANAGCMPGPNHAI